MSARGGQAVTQGGQPNDGCWPVSAGQVPRASAGLPGSIARFLSFKQFPACHLLRYQGTAPCFRAWYALEKALQRAVAWSVGKSVAPSFDTGCACHTLPHPDQLIWPRTPQFGRTFQLLFVDLELAFLQGRSVDVRLEIVFRRRVLHLHKTLHPV